MIPWPRIPGGAAAAAMALALILGWGSSAAEPVEESVAAPEASESSDTAKEEPASEPAAPTPDSRPGTPEEDSTALLRDRLASVNLSTASDKVGFGGILYGRSFTHSYLGDLPPHLWADASRSNLDANYTLKIGVNANAFMKVWSMASFGYDFGGRFLNQRSEFHPRSVAVRLPDGSIAQGVDTVVSDRRRAPYIQDKNRESARIFEDLSAGVEIRTDPVDAGLRAGSALWMEGSPLTIWKRDPRPKLAWYYETYEPEQSTEQYYTQKYFYRRNELGRLSWPKKAFGGIELDAYRLPGNWGLQLDFAQPSNMLPTKTDGNMYNTVGDAEALGSINSLGELYYGRLTRKKVYRDLTLGGNVLWVRLPEDIINQRVFSNASLVAQGFVYQFKNGNTAPFFTNPRVFSFDARGNLSSQYFLQADVALAYEDSVKYLPVPGDTTAFPYSGRSSTEIRRSGISPAAYLKLNSSGTLPMETELFYAAKDFWSPYAMTEYAVPVRYDEMKLGAGNYAYQANLLGVAWKVSPKVSFGFLSLSVGQHVQPEAGKDMLRFQHHLSGREVWHASSSWSRTEPGRMLDEGVPYGNPKYVSRVGEGQRGSPLYLKSQPGGLRGDDLELWEEFAAYDNQAQADSGIVPRNRKYATTLALDIGYNIGALIGYSRPWMVSYYGAVHTISKQITGPAITDNTLLWSGLGRLESVISLSPSFQVIGLLGAEQWLSDKAYRNTLANKQGRDATLPAYEAALASNGIDTIRYDNIIYYESIVNQNRFDQNSRPLVRSEHSPIDYLQLAYGLGFDWDFTRRAGLHVRYKYATHRDKNYRDNDWSGSFLFAETKIWF